MCLLRVSTQKNYIWGVIPKNCLFFAGTGISSLNVQSNSFRTARPISVIRSSNHASPQKKFNYAGQVLHLFYEGIITKKLPNGSLPAQILHSITF
jgi:hypothetical protein